MFPFYSQNFIRQTTGEYVSEGETFSKYIMVEKGEKGEATTKVAVIISIRKITQHDKE